jgi:hypothetical protein
VAQATGIDHGEAHRTGRTEGVYSNLEAAVVEPHIDHADVNP